MKRFPLFLQTGMCIIGLIILQVILLILLPFGIIEYSFIVFIPTFALIAWAVFKYIIMMCKLIWLAMTAHNDYGKETK